MHCNRLSIHETPASARALFRWLLQRIVKRRIAVNFRAKFEDRGLKSTSLFDFEEHSLHFVVIHEDAVSVAARPRVYSSRFSVVGAKLLNYIGKHSLCKTSYRSQVAVDRKQALIIEIYLPTII